MIDSSSSFTRNAGGLLAITATIGPKNFAFFPFDRLAHAASHRAGQNRDGFKNRMGVRRHN